MAKTKWWALWDIEIAASGYEGISPTAKKKGETLPSQELSTKGDGAGTESKGMRGQVFNAKMAVVEAEGGEEACNIAQEVYGKRSGTIAWPLAEKELEFKHD